MVEHRVGEGVGYGCGRIAGAAGGLHVEVGRGGGTLPKVSLEIV